MRKLLPAFTIIELLIAIMIVAAITSLTIISLDGARVRARDANRRTSVEAYSSAIEQWRSISPTKSYFVQLPAGSSPVCDASGTGSDYMAATVIAAPCVGKNGGGAGRITRKGFSSVAPSYQYPSASIADALIASGVLTKPLTDPLDSGKGFDDIAARDFILTTCKTDFTPATTPADALEYAVYANLELPVTNRSTNEERDAKHHCGGADTGNGWNTTDF